MQKKRTFLCLITSILPFLLLISCLSNKKPTVILISLDGFRYDYLDKYAAKNLSQLTLEGVRAKWMTSVFPTLTFPNHYAIVTGLYPENSGIVNNTMYDPVFKATFSLGNRAEVQNSRWWQGEPIWVTAEIQGLRTAPIFFPGSEAAIGGIRPAFWEAYNGKIPNKKRVDDLLSRLDLPVAERPQFFSLYFSDLDDAGHNYSPDSPQVAQSVIKVDAEIGRLIEGLKLRNLYDKVNLILVSDHGMVEVKPGNIVILDDFFDTEKTERIVWGSQLTSIFPKAGFEEEIYNGLRENSSQHFSVYRKSEIPERYHYRNHRRIAPIICLADEGWIQMSRAWHAKKQKENKLSNRLTGAHGYDNQLESMRAIFVAHGPAFKNGIIVEPFENINVYNIMARILELKPAKNDGSMKIADQVLQ